MKARKRPIIVDARGPIKMTELVLTASGRVRAEPGDYILRDPNTADMWPIKGRIFLATYDILEPDRDGL